LKAIGLQTIFMSYRFAVAAILMLMSLCLSRELNAQSSVIRYIDTDAGFVLVDQVGPDVKDGDRVCVFESGKPTPTCDVTFRWQLRNPLLFPKKEFLDVWETGTVLEVKKILIDTKAEQGPTDVVNYNKELLKNREKSSEVEKTKAVVTSNKLPRGAAPELALDQPSIEGDEFPEIYIPKIRKARKVKKDLTEADRTAKAIKKALKSKDLAGYSFETDAPIEDVPPKAVQSDFPNPLHGALEISVLSAMPVLPMAKYNSLAFRTITNATVNRDTLWRGSKTNLEAGSGAGIEIQLINKMSSFVNFGWRYHTYNSLNSRATFDEFDTSLIAYSSTRVSEQVVSGDWGRRQTWTDLFFTSYTLGLDLAYTDVNFKSNVPSNSISAPMVIGFGRHNFLTIAPRTQLRAGIQRWGFAFSLGALFIVPVYDFRNNFSGEVAVPDRIKFQGNPNDDLKNSLAQKRNPVSIEAFFSISYQPQRK
jgi:hypothetical protein